MAQRRISQEEFGTLLHSHLNGTAFEVIAENYQRFKIDETGSVAMQTVDWLCDFFHRSIVILEAPIGKDCSEDAQKVRAAIDALKPFGTHLSSN